MEDKIEDKKKLKDIEVTAKEVVSKKKAKANGKLLSFVLKYSLNLGSNPDGTPKNAYKAGEKIKLHSVKDREKIEKLKNIKII